MKTMRPFLYLACWIQQLLLATCFLPGGSTAFFVHQRHPPLPAVWHNQQHHDVMLQKNRIPAVLRSSSTASSFEEGGSQDNVDVIFDFGRGAIKLKSLSKQERILAGNMLQEESVAMLQKGSSSDSNTPGHNWSSYVELMNEWARLGRPEEAQEFFAKVTTKASSKVPLVVQVACLRSLLHAWSNRLQLVKNSPLASETAEQAANILKQMIREVNNEDDNTGSMDPLLDPADFTRIITNYLDLTTPPLNMTAILEIWNQWQEQSTDSSLQPPSTQLGVKIIRAVANDNNNVNSWEEALEQRDMAGNLGSSLQSSLSVNGNKVEEQDADGTNIYNALLELWSKLLPPPAKQRQKEYNNNNKFVIDDKERDYVGEQTKALLSEMEAAGIPRVDSTYSTILYAYCNCGWLREAWDIWETWKTDLAQSGNSETRSVVDTRSLRMLIQSSLIQAELEEEEAAEPNGGGGGGSVSTTLPSYVQLSTDALEDMWRLYDLGVTEMKPDIDLYTMLLGCWSNPHRRSISMDSARRLADRVIERSPLLRPNKSFYSAWQSVVRSHFATSSSNDTTKGVAEQAGMIIKEMERQSIHDPTVAPDTSFYNFLMDACLSDGSIVGVTRAEQTLDKMLETTGNNNKAQPNGRSFASIIRANLQLNNTAKAEYWLDRMEERFIPSSALFQEVILQCCQRIKMMSSAELAAEGRKQAERAQRLLNRMEELSKVTAQAQLRPDLSLYSCVAEASQRCNLTMTTSSVLSKKPTSSNGSEDDGERTKEEEKRKKKKKRINSNEDVIKLMKEIRGITSEEYDHNEIIQADTTTFNKLIAELANTEKANAGVLAEEIFDYMLDQYVNSGYIKLKPDLITFNSVILAWSKSSHRHAAVRADAFLSNLRDLHIGGVLLDIEPDLISYNTVIAGYQRCADGENAERTFNELRSLHTSTNDERYRPDAYTICSLLGAYANRGDSGRAEELLLHFWKEHKAHQNQVALDTTAFDQVLRAWAKTGKGEGAHRAEILLELMEDMAQTPKSVVNPTTVTYNIVLHALANSGDMGAPARAQELLGRMKAGAARAKPDAVTYTTTITVMSRLGGQRALTMIETLLEEAVDRPDINVDSTFFANVLSSLALCGDSGTIRFAQDLVEKKMPELGIEPDAFVWNALLNCFAKKGMGEEAEKVLDQLERGLSRVEPNVQSYSIVLDAYAKSTNPGSIERAEAIIQRMQESKLKPDAKAYTALIQKYARSNLPLKAKRAQAVLQRMKEGAQDGFEEVKPTVVTYNALLNACEYTNSTDLQEKEEAFEVACLAFDEVQKTPGLDPTHATFGSFLGVVARLMPRSEARNEIAELVFKRCCKEGQVSQYVLRKLRTAVSLSHYRQMLGGNREERIPRKWTVNVRQRRFEVIGRAQNRRTSKTAGTL